MLFLTTIVSMESDLPTLPANCICTSPKNDGSFPDDVYINTSHGLIKETYENYYYSFDMINKKYSRGQVSFEKAPFIQLVVQAAITVQDKKDVLGDNIKPLYELLDKIRRKKIKTATDIIKINKKDTYRLLSYIPTGKVHSLVNGKKIRILFKPEYTAHEREEDKEFLAQMPDLFPANPHDGFSYTGCQLSITGTYNITFDYNFISDSDHHELHCALFDQMTGDYSLIYQVLYPITLQILKIHMYHYDVEKFKKNIQKYQEQFLPRKGMAPDKFMCPPYTGITKTFAKEDTSLLAQHVWRIVQSQEHDPKNIFDEKTAYYLKAPFQHPQPLDRYTKYEIRIKESGNQVIDTRTDVDEEDQKFIEDIIDQVEYAE